MNRLPRKLIFGIITFFLPLCLLFGCSRKNITPQDTLVVAISAEPANLNPLFALDALSQRIDKLLYDALVDIDSHLQVVPHLAESWENPSDKVYRFKIRRDAFFHNGAPITAEAMFQSLKQILDPKVGSPFLTSFKNIEKVTIINPYSLEIRLYKPQASFLTDLTLIKAIPESGPYQLVSKDTNRIILKRNPSHFKFKPKMEKIAFAIVKDNSTRILKLKKGEVDLIQNDLSADSVKQIENDRLLTMTNSAGLTYSYLGFNLKDPILKNKKVRQAIAHAIHREEIIQYLLQNFATPAHNLLSPMNEYYENHVKTYDFNLQESEKLLSDSGIKPPIRLEYKTSTDTEAVNIAKLIADQLKKIGIEVTLRTHEWGTFFNDIQNGNFQLFSLRWVGVTDPDIYYEAFHSSNFPPGKNRVYYSNSELDKLLEKGRTTIDTQKRKKIFSRVQKTIAEDLPYISLWYTNNVAAYSHKIKGFYFHPQANFTPFIDISKTQ